MVSPASLPPISPVVEQHRPATASNLKQVYFGNSRLQLSETAFPVIQIAEPNEQAQSGAKQGTDSSSPTGQQSAQTAEKRTFWERLFKMQPMSKRLEKVLTEEWKFTDIKPRNIEWLLSEEGEEARLFFISGSNARQYQRLVKEYGCGFETRTGRVVDDNFDTLSEYGTELLQNYNILMENKTTIKRYFGGVFRDGRIGTQALIRISSSMWFGPFEAPRFRQFAGFLKDRFQVPDHVIGPMLASVGDSLWLRQVMSRRASPQEFQKILTKISPTSENSGNAFAPALQLMVIGEEHKIPFQTLITFLDDLKLQPKDFGAFSAIEFNLGAYRMASEIKCQTFAQYVRKLLDEYGQDINQESARMLLFSYREFKTDGEVLNSMLSPKYSETKAFLKSVGTVSSNIWNLQRIAILTQTLTPEKKAKITSIARQLAAELTVADIMFIAEIADNDEEVKMLLDRNKLVAGVKDIPIDRIIERSHNDLVKELEREIDNANSNGLYRTVRRLRGMINSEKQAYTERVDPNKLTNIQLSRLLIFHRSLEIPGFMDTVGWNVSLDLQNDRSEGGGYLGYDKDMAMVTMIAGQPGDNKQYRPVNLNRAPASLALFHNHAFKDTFAQQYLGFVGKMFPFLPKSKNKDPYAGPSGWVGAKKGDITAAAESELPSFIITKIGYPQNPDGTKDKKKLLVNFDWVIVDKASGEALRSDRGVFTVPYYSDNELGKLTWPSKKEMRRREKDLREKCPPSFKGETAAATAGQQRDQ
ncbi:MAG: hypothetical protein ACKVZH_09545 [Blastocatellia bacterium]